MNQEKINLRQVRDFGETFNTSVKFVRQNFKLFFQSLLFIAGPFLLISSIAGAFYQANAITMQSKLQSGIASAYATDPMDIILDQFGWTYFIFIIASILANLALVGTVYAFILNYIEKGPGQFTVNDISSTLLKNAGGILGIFFGLTLLIILIVGGVVALGVAIGFAVPALGILFLVAAFFGMLILFPPLIWQLSVVYLVRMEEGTGVLGSYGKTKEVMRGNFWWTWLIVVCSSFGIGIIGIIFSLPQVAYQLVLTFSSLKGGENETSIGFVIVATLCTFCTTMLYSFMYVINGVHYYSLAEKNDGKGLMERINEIGTTPTTNVNQHY
ncbi:MAG: hypothetical protein IPP64_02700 [Bacteroidetes bacterium]|nr:hypothetical protein [Bacteroidota bacterium]